MRPDPDPFANEVFMLTAEAVVLERWAAAKRRRTEVLRTYVANLKLSKRRAEGSNS